MGNFWKMTDTRKYWMYSRFIWRMEYPWWVGEDRVTKFLEESK